MMEITATARWQDFLNFGDDRPNPQTMIENGKVRIIVAGLKAGQRIPVHPEAAAIYHFLEGEGTMTVENEEYPVREGTVITMAEGASRGLLAETQLVFMAVRLA